MKTKIITSFIASTLLLAITASAEPDLDKLFASQDTDGSGGVSLQELTNARVEWATKQAKKKGLSESELAEKINGITENTAKQFKKIDKNKDGELNKAEWMIQRKGAK